MATVNFRVKKSASNKGKIYVVLSIGRGKVYESKLPYEIPMIQWDNTRKYPRQNSEHGKKLKDELMILERYLIQSLDEAQLNKIDIEKEWFKSKVFEFLNPVSKQDESRIVNHIQRLIDSSSTRRVKGSDHIGLSKSRVNGYANFKKILEDYELFKHKRFTFLDVSSQFVDDFTDYLINTKKYSKNYAGKQLSNLKTVCFDADRLLIPVNRYVYHIYGFRENNLERKIITLTHDELLKIQKADMPNEKLENAKKWLILGCEVGQRGEDLLNVKWDEMYSKDEYNLIDIYQSKTNKWVTVPIISTIAIDIILKYPPRKISLTKLNSYIKDVCQISEIDTIVVGKKCVGGGSDRRSVRTELPKYKLISSHCFRRTFVTLNDEIIDRQSVMEISGHSKESSYLYYINKHTDRSEKAISFARQKIKNSSLTS
jgi:integrase